jgi:hypothetical protein
MTHERRTLLVSWVGAVGAGVINGHLIFEFRDAFKTFGLLAPFLGFLFFQKGVVSGHFCFGTSLPYWDSQPWMLICVCSPRPAVCGGVRIRHEALE